MPTSPRRVVLHTESSLGRGGQEFRILTEVRWLLDHGWEALIACQPASQLLDEARAAGLPAVAVRMRSAVDPLAFLRLRRLMRARGVALVTTHSSVDSWLATLAARSLGLGVVRTRHVAIAILRRRALVYRLADRVVTTGEAVARQVAAAGVARERIVTIPTGIDPARFHPGVSGRRVREELGLAGASPPKLVGLVANIRGSKGHRFFLEAAREIAGVMPDVRFLVVGDGVGYDDVRRRVTELALGDRVVMTGFRRDIPEVMAALDVLVLPSVRSEATPQVIPQALAVGTPVVATSAGAIPEIVRDGETGRLVPPADGRALAAAIVALLREPAEARRLAERGRTIVAERYTVDVMMTSTLRVYTDVLGR